MTCFLKSCALAKQMSARNVATSTGANRSLCDVMEKTSRRDWLPTAAASWNRKPTLSLIYHVFGAGLTAKWNLFHFAELRRTKWVERPERFLHEHVWCRPHHAGVMIRDQS